MTSSDFEANETDLTNAPVRAIAKNWNSITSAARNNRAEITRTGNRAVRDKHAHAFEFRGGGWKIGDGVCLSRRHVVLQNLPSKALE